MEISILHLSSSACFLHIADSPSLVISITMAIGWGFYFSGTVAVFETKLAILEGQKNFLPSSSQKRNFQWPLKYVSYQFLKQGWWQS